MDKSTFIRRAVAVLFAGAMAFSLLGAAGCAGGNSSSSSAGGSAGTDNSAVASGKHHAVIEIEGYDPIVVELDADSAPITVQNFMDLANSGFYDGLTFHRIIEGFMMQGGDPKGNGTGGSSNTIKGEFSENGVENNILHKRGTISMARSQLPDSASSQFFIVQQDSDFLDGKYAGFGHVTEGMETVDAICSSAQPTDSNGTIAAAQQPKISSIRILD